MEDLKILILLFGNFRSNGKFKLPVLEFVPLLLSIMHLELQSLKMRQLLKDQLSILQEQSSYGCSSFSSGQEKDKKSSDIFS